MDDQRILDLYFTRNEQAIRETADRYGALCMRVAMNILGNRSDAEECVNDAYLKMWNSIPPARPRVLSAFLSRITRNLALDRYRTLHRDRRNRDFVILLSELEDCVPAPDDGYGDARELLNHITAFLRGVDTLDRNLFVGRYFHAYTVSKLAEGYGLTANAVSVRLCKTRNRLRVYLNERGYQV